MSTGTLCTPTSRFKSGEPALGIGGRYVANYFPEDPPWEFVAIGKGHGVEYWTRFLTALRKVNPEIAVNIEHEDVELGQVEGLSFAAENLVAAAKAIQSAA
jgi:sugar phosphate isomerase/epimerase